jgi:ABC-2 type transport system ATP-binding protein
MLEIKNLVHTFKTKKVSRNALDGISLSVNQGEIFAVLGPNGSGKTTLFRILSTLFLPASGMVTFLGMDLAKDYRAIRKKIGVVFQSPALDLKLTVFENLLHQGHLYGLSGVDLRRRVQSLLERLGLLDRQKDMAGTLSGGLKRRVELAKGLLHKPAVLLLDEPSTGLDPGARAELWNYLLELRRTEGVSVLVTTHFMDEAERSDRLVIMNNGKIAALGSPKELLKTVGSDFAEIVSAEPVILAEALQKRFGWHTAVMGRGVRVEHPGSLGFAAELLSSFPAQMEQVTFRKATLEDVFLAKTGQSFGEGKKV